MPERNALAAESLAPVLICPNHPDAFGLGTVMSVPCIVLRGSPAGIAMARPNGELRGIVGVLPGLSGVGECLYLDFYADLVAKISSDYLQTR